MAKVYVIGAAKGGTAKTVSSYNLAYSLVEKGKKVLAVDLDPQSNLTTCFGVDDTAEVPVTIGHLMMAVLEEEELPDESEYIWEREGVDFIPASMMLSAVDAKLRLEMGTEKILSRILDEVKDGYDTVIIDTCPSMGALTINALSAADYVIVTANPQLLAMKGLQDFLKTVSKIKSRINDRLQVAGILLTMCEGRTNLCKTITEEVQDTFKGKLKVFKSMVPSTVKVGESVYYGQPLMEYILRNQAYIGNLVQGRRRSRLCDNEKRHFTDKEEWLITEGTHEPIVGREIYEKVRKLFENKVKESSFSSDRGKDIPKKDDKYFGILFCGNCGKRLLMQSRISRGKKIIKREYFYQCCITYDKEHQGYCKTNIMERLLDHIVLEAIKKQVQLLSDKEITVEYCESSFEDKLKPLEEKIRKAEEAIKKQEYEDFETHEKYGIGEISRKEMETLQAASEKKLVKLKDRLTAAKDKYADRKKELDEYIAGVKAAYRVKGVPSLDRETLTTLIDRIVIQPSGEFEITWNFEKGFRSEADKYRKGAKKI